MKLLLKFLFLSPLVTFLSISYAQSGIVENKFIEVLEGICLLNKDDFTHIDKMATALKLKPAPNELLQADAAIANRGGKGYIFEVSGHEFLIGYVLAGGCAVVSSSINSDLGYRSESIIHKFMTLGIVVKSTAPNIVANNEEAEDIERKLPIIPPLKQQLQY